MDPSKRQRGFFLLYLELHMTAAQLSSECEIFKGFLLFGSRKHDQSKQKLSELFILLRISHPCQILGVKKKIKKKASISFWVERIQI